MLNHADFVTMLGDLRKQMLNTINTLDSLSDEIDDKELLYRLKALNQCKRQHMAAMNALATLVKAAF